jgi:dTDP-4-amino-4,6-dideoxygalactose transaminase
MLLSTDCFRGPVLPMTSLRAFKPTAPAPIAPDVIPIARPFLPPAGAVLPYLRDIDERRWYANWGPLLVEFEARLKARLAPQDRLTTVANATQGLALTLNALGLPAGSLVALPSWTFVATAHAVLQAGLTPWFLDVDPDSWSLTTDGLSQALRRAPGPVSAAIVVSPFGRPLDSAAWADFSRTHGLPVVIDAAAAFDTVHDAPLPTVVSLHATKVLGVGEGGFVACRDSDFIDRLRGLTSYGFRGSRESQYPATNAKLSEYAAAVGMAGLDGWPTTRMRYGLVAQGLRIALHATPEVEFQPGWGSQWVSSVCMVKLPDGSADRVERALAAEGVETRRWWAGGCHGHPAFAGLPRTDLTVTQALARSTIGLPYAMDMHGRTISRIADAVSRAVRAG